MGDLHAPGGADGPEHRLLVVPPHPSYLDIVLSADCASGGRGDAAVYENQLEPVRDTLSVRWSRISSLARFS